MFLFVYILLNETRRVTRESFDTAFFSVTRWVKINSLKSHFLLFFSLFISLCKYFFKNLQNSSNLSKLSVLLLVFSIK